MNIRIIGILTIALMVESCSASSHKCDKGTTVMDTQKDEHEIAPRKVSDVFSYYDWTDGNVIYRLNSHKGDVDNHTGAYHSSPRCESYECYEFRGETLLEGGYGICLEGYNENSWHSVNGDAEAVEYQYVGCTVTLLPDMDALVFLNETDDGIENILIPVRYPMLSPDLILKKVMEDDYIKYMLCGRFKTVDGRTMTFDSETRNAQGTFFGDSSFEIVTLDLTPVPIIKIKEKYYFIEKLDGPINLLQVDLEEGNGMGLNLTGDKIVLTRLDKDYWPELTRKVLTVSELYKYAGYNPTPRYDISGEQLNLHRKDLFARMRESVMAKYDYQESKLPDAAKINVQILQMLENDNIGN